MEMAELFYWGARIPGVLELGYQVRLTCEERFKPSESIPFCGMTDKMLLVS